LEPVGGIQIGSYVEGEGKALFNLTKDKDMEGLIAKRKDSIYRPGKRTSDWLKIKARLQQQFVVGGFAEGKGSRQRLGSLLLGAYRNGKLHYFGRSRLIAGCREISVVLRYCVPELNRGLSMPSR